jgi:photosynthetic reaction center cytochrome c subunit
MIFMPRLPLRSAILAFAATPFIVVLAQDIQPKQAPMAEQVFKNIQVFKGVPANDLIPSMEFMAASLKYECSDCHDAKDFAAETRTKETARHMILMQRDINTKNFGGRLQVTCMTCHRGSEHPVSTPIPDGMSLRHTRLESAPKPEELFAKHIAAAGKPGPAIVFTGTLTAPNDATHKVETTPLEFIQAEGGKFRMVAGERKVTSDGAGVYYGTMAMTDEPAAIFGRIGHAWRGEGAFAMLNSPQVSGKDTIGKAQVIVVRGQNPASNSTQEFYFDAKSGLLLRLMNVRRSSLGNVVSVIDYANYRNVAGTQVPMRIVSTFAGGEQWIMDFKSAKPNSALPDSTFKIGQ